MLNNILKISLLFIVIIFAASFSVNAAQSETAGEKADTPVKDAVSKTDDERDYIYDPTERTDPFKSFIALRNWVC